MEFLVRVKFGVSCHDFSVMTSLLCLFVQ